MPGPYTIILRGVGGKGETNEIINNFPFLNGSEGKEGRIAGGGISLPTSGHEEKNSMAEKKEKGAKDRRGEKGRRSWKYFPIR